MRILIIDDDFVSRTKLVKILDCLGECHQAVSGQEALEAFAMAHQDNLPYDLITVDIRLPDMTGQELVNKIRDWEHLNGAALQERETHILMVSVLSDSKSIMSSFKQGCEAYITKPFNRHTIFNELSKLKLVG